MDYIIKIGTHFEVEVGTPEEPEITRWTSWGLGDLQQSFLLHTSEGTLMVDPVLPQLSESLKAIKQRAGRVQAILSLSPLHERHIAEAARRYRAPVYGPPAAKTTTQYGRKLGVRYGSGQPLPGGVQTIESGDDNGEMWLYWKTPKGKKVLINADTIYGQNEAGGMGGRNVSYWMQEKGIRLRATGALSQPDSLASISSESSYSSYSDGAPPNHRPSSTNAGGPRFAPPKNPPPSPPKASSGLFGGRKKPP